jgi:hypothetical protein
MGCDSTVTARLFLNGLDVYGEFTLLRCKDSGDYMFESLKINNTVFTRLEHECLLQWIYLLSPEAFQMALEGTCWQRGCLSFVNKSCAVQDDTRIYWNLTVNHLLAASSATGIEICPRELRLEFSI